MDGVVIEVPGGEVDTLRELVKAALKERIEALRQGEWTVEKAGKEKNAPERIEAFFEDALELLGSPLAGLYRLFLREELPALLEAEIQAPKNDPD